MNFRTEKDTLGEISVPAERLWGAQTQRSLENFQIGGHKMPLEMIYALATVKKAAALTNADLNVLPKEKAALIVKVCEEILAGKWDEEFPLVVWQTGSGTQTNMNMNEVIANRAHVLSGGKLDDAKKVLHPNDDVNASQSSNDVFPTAMHIAAYLFLMQKTIPNLIKLQKSLEKKAREFSQIVKIGRTHLMDATPLTLGQEFSGYAAQLEQGISLLQNVLPRLLELALGGTAVGTGINAPEGFAEKAAQHIAEITGAPFVSAPNKFAALAGHEALVAVHSALKTIAVSLFKIASDIRLLGSGPRSGFGELILPANEPGSSIMPGKVNPTQCEALTMVCAQIMGNDTAVTFAAAQGHLELNVFKPVIIWNVLTSAQLLADAADSFAMHCVDGIEANEKRIAQHLHNSLMLVTALSPHVGYEKAATIAKEAYAKDISLREAATLSGFVTEKEFDTWVESIINVQ